MAREPVIKWQATCPVIAGSSRGELQLFEIESEFTSGAYAVKLSLDGRAVAAFANESSLVMWCESIIERVRKADKL